MKPIKKPFAKSSQKPQCVSDGKSRSNMIILLWFQKKSEKFTVFPHTDIFYREWIDRTL